MSELSRETFRFFHLLRVRWSEVDPQNIVFNGHYLTYADIGITEYFRALGLKYPTDLSRDGADFFVVKSVLEYRAPACFDDPLLIGVRIARFGHSSLNFELGIWREETQITRGEIIYVHADSQTRNSCPLPEWLKTRVINYEHIAPEQ